MKPFGIKLSTRMQVLEESPLMRLSQMAEELRRTGQDIIALGVGEPDWNLSEFAQAKTFSAISSGEIKYTSSAGNLKLREAVAIRTHEDTGNTFSANQILITPGGKFGIFELLQALLNPGDEVIVPAPYWPSYMTMVRLADGNPVIAPSDAANGFKLTAEILRKNITPRTKIVLLNSPSNPTGATYTIEEWKKLAAVFREHPEIIIVTDDLYNQIVFTSDASAPHLLRAAPDLGACTFIVNGVSKSYAMTGWRLGWIAGDSATLKSLADYQSQTISSVSAVAQVAALAALTGPQDVLENAVLSLRSRRLLGITALNDIEGIRVVQPEGAFYFWVDVRDLLKRRVRATGGEAGKVIATDTALAELLLVQAKIAVVPGSHFGTPGYLRMSFVVDENQLTKALARFASFVSSLL